MVSWAFRAIRDYLLPIVLGGLIGGLLVSAFLVWPAVYGAKWWEVFTALGTVGATIMGVAGWRRQLTFDRSRALSSGWLINSWLSQVWAGSVEAAILFRELANTKEGEASDIYYKIFRESVIELLDAGGESAPTLADIESTFLAQELAEIVCEVVVLRKRVMTIDIEQKHQTSNEEYAAIENIANRVAEKIRLYNRGLRRLL